MGRLRKWWRFLLLFVSRRSLPPPPSPPETPPADPAEPPATPAWTTPTLEEAEAVAANRQERRRLERARRRRDKLVQPKLDHIEAVIERPPPKTEERKEKKKSKKKPEIAIIDDPNDVIIADELVHGDGLGHVLFEESEFYGEFNFRDSILDQLERYWFYLSRMRHHQPYTYQFYRQLGAVLVPFSRTGINRKYSPLEKLTSEEIEEIKRDINLSPWFKKIKPAWGCIAYGTDPLTEKREQENKVWVPKFLYFSKYERAPPEIQAKPGEGDIYKLTVWWDTPVSKIWKRHKWGIPNDIPIFVSEDCSTIVPLKSIRTKMVRVGKRGNNFNYDLIPQRAWRFPKHYEDWASDHGLSIDLHLPHMFCCAMRDYEMSQYAMARVSVTKGDLTATFGINPRRLAYFFRDRDVIVTVNGRHKRIIHYVRSHIKEDRTAIKAHFRGAREFSWAGYKVLITIPGRDHLLLPEFNVGMSDEFWWQNKKDKDMIDEEKMGRLLSKVVQGTPLKDAINDERRASE